MEHDVAKSLNILVVSLYPLERNTSVANSSISIIQGILGLNHQVTMLMPDWPCNESGCDLANLRVVRILGKPDQPYSNKSKLCGKLHSHLDVLDTARGYMTSIKYIDFSNEYFDIILSFSEPSVTHIFTAELIRKKKVLFGRWIQHWGDPITGDFTRHYWWPDSFIKWYERSIIRKADKAVFVTPFTYEMERAEHPMLAHKIAFAPLPAEMLPSVEAPISKELRLSYLGDYNPSIRNLRPLYDACVNKDEIRLTIAGYGPKYPDCDNVTIYSRIPQQKAQQIENDSDVLICICNLTGTMIPGKIMYKASTNKHILVAVEDDNYEAMREYFESFNRYILCRNTPESISVALDSLRGKSANYSTPEKLLPINVAKEILK